MLEPSFEDPDVVYCYITIPQGDAGGSQRGFIVYNYSRTMFRISVVVSVFLILSVTAKPWNKLTNEAYEEKVLSIVENGKLSWEVEVEPPEDMDGIHYEIDPRMRIWKNMKSPVFEEDLDEQLHPSTAELHAQIQNLNRAAEVQKEPPKNPKEDRDDIAHPVFAEMVAEEPEKAWNEEYKKLLGSDEDQPSLSSRRDVRIHLKPEEDMDALYHKDILVPVLQQDNTKAAAPEDLLSQPEEDLDGLYHQ